MRELITQRKNLSEVKFAAQDIVDDFVGETLKGDWPFKSDTEIPFVRKFYIQDEIITKATPRQKLDAGQVVHYISTAAVDRDHEVLDPKGVQLKHYKKNPQVLWSHDPRDPDNIIGKNIWINQDQKGLVALTQFALSNEKASKVYNLYKDGFLKAWSVGFVPLVGRRPKSDEKLTIVIGEDLKPGEIRYVHEKWELLEYSAVGVPSNPEALTEQVAKGYELTDELIKELEINLEDIEIGKDNKTIIDLGGILDDGESEEKGKEGETKEDGEENKADEKYKCECIECGHKVTSEKHCTDFKCPECGGKMRRQERPGPGKEIEAEPDERVDAILEQLKEMKSELSEVKAGREISAKNMKMLTEVAESMEKATTAVRVLLEANTSEEGKSDDSESIDVDALLKETDIDKEDKIVLTKKDQLEVLKDLSMEDLAQSVIEKRKGKVS